MTLEELRDYVDQQRDLGDIPYHVYSTLIDGIDTLEQEPKMGRCKDCKYFKYDSLTKVDGIKLIFAHEICSRWGDGCKTKEDGYCFLFETKMQEVEK